MSTDAKATRRRRRINERRRQEQEIAELERRAALRRANAGPQPGTIEFLMDDHAGDAAVAARRRYAERVERMIEQADRRTDGFVTGPLRFAAEHLADQVIGTLGEDLKRADGLHREAIIRYLVGCWGDVAHAFPGRPDLPGYLEWREDCTRKARTAANVPLP